MSTRPGDKGGRCVRLTTYHLHVPLSRNLGALTSWNPVGLFRSVMGQLYLLHLINNRKREHYCSAAVNCGPWLSVRPLSIQMVSGHCLLVFLLPSIHSSSSWSLHLRGLSIPTSVAVAVCSGILSARPCYRSRTVGVSLKIMHPVVLYHKIKNKQITIEHSFIKYSYCYKFRPSGSSSG
jgi:hypothetical protein